MFTLTYQYKFVEEQKLLSKERRFQSYSYLFAATTTTAATTPEAKSKAADYNSYYYSHANSVYASNDSILVLSGVQQVNGICCFGADCMQIGVYEA
jgi:hypothetical protein